MGRPSTYTPEMGDEIAKRCVMKSLNAVCKDEGMPVASTVYLWLIEHKDFSDKYARAREARAFRRLESVDAIMAKVKKGALDPAAARVLLDAIKWQAAKENPRALGDKLDLHHGGSVGFSLNVRRRKPE